MFSNSTETRLFHGEVVDVVRVAVDGPGGSTHQREVVRHPGAVVVVPVRSRPDTAPVVILVRQYRASVGEELLELPAGKRDVDGEAPEQTASRELAEEVGMSAGRLELLARFYNSPGFCDELSWLYLASDLQAVPASPQGPEEAHMQLVELPLGEAEQLIASGQIKDAKTMVGLLLASRRLAGLP